MAAGSPEDYAAEGAHTPDPGTSAAVFGTPVWDNSAADYARIKEGRDHLTLTIEAATASGDWERVVAHEHALPWVRVSSWWIFGGRA